MEFYVHGFQAAGIHSGIKEGKGKDLALIYSERPATVAGLFTTNRVKAAPVILDMERVKGGKAQAVVINSGNANACTGERGLKDAREMARLVGRAIGVEEDLVLVASTGVIGEFLPMERIREGIDHLVGSLSPEGWQDASEAIMTTDTRPKLFFGQEEIGGRMISLLGIAKGAGMIMPNMATMLAFFATDLSIEVEALKGALRDCVEETFNRITVDGETSTNDTVLILANGMAGNGRIREKRDDYHRFRDLLLRGCETLSRLIVEDGEGATKVIEVEVRRARDDEDARAGAFRVANSLLVKTALYGCDPNWGRIMASLGSAVKFLEEKKVAIRIDGIPLVEGGIRVIEDEGAIREILKGRFVRITIDLGLGGGRAKVLTTDLSPEYVRINAAYRT